MTSCNLIAALKAPSPNTGSLGIRVSTYELGAGDIIQAAIFHHRPPLCLKIIFSHNLQN